MHSMFCVYEKEYRYTKKMRFYKKLYIQLGYLFVCVPTKLLEEHRRNLIFVNHELKRGLE
jgi:hypothetical protein